MTRNSGETAVAGLSSSHVFSAAESPSEGRGLSLLREAIHTDRQRMKQPMPSRPVPSSAKADGSGVFAIIVVTVPPEHVPNEVSRNSVTLTYANQAWSNEEQTNARA